MGWVLHYYERLCGACTKSIEIEGTLFYGFRDNFSARGRSMNPSRSAPISSVFAPG